MIETAAVFTHCAKSFRRGGVWDPGTWPQTTRSPALEARFRQLGLDVSFDDYAADNEGKIAAGLAADRPG